MESAEATQRFMDMRQQVAHGVDHCCGWLEKLGGAHGGRKAWQRRWFVLTGSTLYYYTSASDAAAKGSLSLAGSVVTADAEDPTTFHLHWPVNPADNPERSFRALSTEEAEDWQSALRRALRFDRLRGGRRPFGATTTPAATAAAAAANASSGQKPEDEIAPMVPVPRVKPSEVSLTFAMAGEGAKAPAAFVCGSVREYERWYLGLTAAIATRKGQNAEAREAAARATLAAAPKDALAHVVLGLALEAQGKAADAIKSAAAALALQPGLASAHKLAGRALLNSNGSTADALKHLQTSAALVERQDEETMLLLGRAYEASGNNKLASTCYDFALVLNPRSVAAQNAMGDLLLARQAYEEAAGHYAASAKSYSEQPEVRLKLAGCYEHLSKLPAAAEELEKGLATSAAKKDKAVALKLHAELARVLPLLGKHAASIAHAAAVSDADPSNPSKLLALAKTYVEAEVARLGDSFGAPVLRKSVRTVTVKRKVFVPAPAPASADGGDGGEGEGEEGDEEGEYDEEGPVAGEEVEMDVEEEEEYEEWVQPSKEPVLSGLAAIDDLSSRDLLTKAEALVASAAAMGPPTPAALVVVGRLNERLAALEDTPAEEKAARSAAAQKAYESVLAIVADLGKSELPAPLGLARMAKAAGNWEAAQSNLRMVLSIDVGHAEATDMLGRVKRLAAGQPEFAPLQPPKKKKAEEIQYADIGLMVPRTALSADMSTEERNAAYFAQLKEDKARREAEAKAAEDRKVASMTPEERAEYEKEKAAKEKHEARKDKMLQKQLGSYTGGTGAAAMRGRGRGRGRGGAARGGH